jgi:hypothetical protein
MKIIVTAEALSQTLDFPGYDAEREATVFYCRDGSKSTIQLPVRGWNTSLALVFEKKGQIQQFLKQMEGVKTFLKSCKAYRKLPGAGEKEEGK